MGTIDEEAASKFINALIKSVQTLCHGYLDFDTGIEIIGHINLSVDKIGSLDYILKEKVCRNDENSTLFISNSFHAHPKSEQPVKPKNSQPESQVVQRRQSSDSSESGKLTSAISSISSALSSAKDSSGNASSSRPQQSTAKRKAHDDLNSDHRSAKAASRDSHFLSSHSQPSPNDTRTSSPLDSKASLSGVTAGYEGSPRTSGNEDVHGSATMLPQTASVTSDNPSDLDVNLAGSVLERVDHDDQSNSEMAEKDDSDLDLEVTFIKEEFVEGERSACEFQGSGGGQQYSRVSHHRGSASSDGMGEQPLFPVALHSNAAATYVPGGQDMMGMAQHYGVQPGAMGPSTSQPQPGPSGMRGAFLEFSQDSQQSTSKITELRLEVASRRFEGWLQRKNKAPVTSGTTLPELDLLLCSFYKEVRKKDGTPLKEHALRTLRSGLVKYFSKIYGRYINMSSADFASSNNVLMALVSQSPSRITQILSPSDLTFLRGHRMLAMDTPLSLLRKVWFELQLHFGARRWSPREMWPEVFVFANDTAGNEFVHMNPRELSQTELRSDIVSMVLRRRMYARSGPYCPVQALKLYLSKRLSSVSEKKAPFLLTPNPGWHPESLVAWYTPSELSTSRARNFMRDISYEAELRTVYTNMSLCVGDFAQYSACWPQTP